MLAVGGAHGAGAKPLVIGVTISQTEDRVDLLAGPYASAISQAVIPVVEELHRVMVGQTAATSLFEGAHYAVQGFPQGSTYLPGVADVAKAAAADVVAGCAFLPGSIALARELAAQGVKPKLKVFSIGPTDPTFGASLGPAAEGVVGSTTWWPSLKTKGNADFVASYERTFRRTPVYHSAAAYASLQVLAAAVRTAGSLDQDRIRTALVNLRRNTVAGMFRIDASGRQIGYGSYLMQWQDGSQRLVWPTAAAETPVRTG